MKISVIIPTCNAVAYLNPQLSVLEGQARPIDEIIIIDSQSDDNPLLKNPCKFKVIGLGLPVDLEKSLISKGVVCSGFLDNPYDEIANAKALIAPLFSGAGVKVKVVETLACGTPVIGNEIAFEGISVEFSKFMLMNANAEDFINSIYSLSFDVQERVMFKKNFIYRYGKNTLGEIIDV